MKNWILIVATPCLIALFVVGVMLYRYINSSEAAAEAQPRPQNVPAQASWVGGADGGVYIQTVKFERKRAQLKVFMETGDVLSEGWFSLSEGCEFDTSEQMAEEFGGFDGNVVILKKENPKHPRQLCLMEMSR